MSKILAKINKKKIVLLFLYNSIKAKEKKYSNIKKNMELIIFLEFSS